MLEYYDHIDSSQVHLHYACSNCSPAIADQVIPSSALQPAWLNQTSLVTGRISQKVMPQGNAGATIDANGNLSGTPDSKYITSWTYYSPTDTAAPPSGCGSGSADSAGRPIAVTNGAGTTCSSYDGEGRLTSTEAPGDSQATSFSYDPAGLTLTASDATGTVSSSYDEAGRLKDSVDSFGAETSYAYDGDGNTTTRTAATGALASSTNYTTGYGYDAADELTGLTDPAGKAYTFFYDSRGNLKATQYPNGTFSWNDIDPLGEITGLYNRHGTLTAPLPSSVPADSQSSPLVDYAYTYADTDGEQTQQVMSGGGLTSATTQYGYDTIGRLNQVVLPDGSCRKYSYDLDSNRTQLQQSSSGCNGSFTTTASYSYDPKTTPGIDELTSQTGPTRSFSYDTDGHTTERGSDTISWDGWNRTTGGTFSGTTVSYSYDPAGNLRTRTGGSTTTRYLYGGTGTPLFETTTSGTITTTYVQGPAGDLAHYSGPPTSGSTITYRYDNSHGDLAATADNSGTRTASYTYQAFGTPIESVPSNTTTQRWTGAYDKHLDTTSNLIQMGARPYDPSVGRFLAPDPIEGGSLNPYDYAGQDPINNYDLDGTCIKHFGWACKGGRAVGHFVVQHSGTISTVTGGIALVGYGSCAFTGVGCGVGLVFSLASSGAASLHAAHACSANVKSAKCVSAAVGAAASILGTGAAAKFAKPAFQALPGRPVIFATTWATKQGGKVNFWLSLTSFGAGFGAQQGLSR